MYILSKGNRLHQLTQEILSKLSYTAVCAKSYDHQSNSDDV